MATKRATSSPYSAEEDAVLRALYPIGKFEDIIDGFLLSERTETSLDEPVRKKINQIGKVSKR